MFSPHTWETRRRVDALNFDWFSSISVNVSISANCRLKWPLPPMRDYMEIYLAICFFYWEIGDYNNNNSDDENNPAKPEIKQHWEKNLGWRRLWNLDCFSPFCPSRWQTRWRRSRPTFLILQPANHDRRCSQLPALWRLSPVTGLLTQPLRSTHACLLIQRLSG